MGIYRDTYKNTEQCFEQIKIIPASATQIVTDLQRLEDDNHFGANNAAGHMLSNLCRDLKKTSAKWQQKPQ